MCGELQGEGSVGLLENGHQFRPYRLRDNNSLSERIVKRCSCCREFENKKDADLVSSLEKNNVLFSMVLIQ